MKFILSGFIVVIMLTSCKSSRSTGSSGDSSSLEAAPSSPKTTLPLPFSFTDSTEQFSKVFKDSTKRYRYISCQVTTDWLNAKDYAECIFKDSSGNKIQSVKDKTAIGFLDQIKTLLELNIDPVSRDRDASTTWRYEFIMSESRISCSSSTKCVISK